MDASFLYMETPSQHAHVVGTLLLDPSEGEGFSTDRVVSMLRARMHLLEPFRRRLAWVPLDLGHPVWVEDPDFDIEAHVHRVTVPAPGTLHELADVVGDIAGRPLDRSRPLWELHLVDGLADGKVGMVTKIHHAAIDGVTGADLMAYMFDLTPDAPDPDPPDEPWVGEPIPSDLELMVGALGHLARRPRALLKVVGNTVRSVTDIVQSRRDAAKSDRPSPAMPFTAPKTMFTGAITPHRSVAFGKASLEDMRAIKSTFGTTVNDVVLAASAMTLRRYLLLHDDLPDRPLLAAVPVSVHGPGTGEGINQVSNMFVRLPVDIEDPVEGLRRIRDETKDAKAVHNAMGVDLIQDMAQITPPGVYNLAMRLYASSGVSGALPPVQNLVISNVPGPPIPLYIAGARVTSIFPFGPLIEGSGINITVLSNMGNMDFGVIACGDTVPDVWEIADGFGAAVTELRKLAEEAADA
jgi:WS/DGAT/MGAT family acyltransferase